MPKHSALEELIAAKVESSRRDGASDVNREPSVEPSYSFEKKCVLDDLSDDEASLLGRNLLLDLQFRLDCVNRVQHYLAD